MARLAQTPAWKALPVARQTALGVAAQKLDVMPTSMQADVQRCQADLDAGRRWDTRDGIRMLQKEKR
jgi:hypothetical protein